MNNDPMITLRPVETKRDLKRFIRFQRRLFKNHPTYIPPLDSDEKLLLTRKNPSLEHCDLRMWLALKDNQVVGRVAAIINHSVNERWNKHVVRFGWLDTVEDYEVFKALIERVMEYGREMGMEAIEGPMGFTDMDKECWAIDNFDARKNMTLLYNPEYYVRFIERMDFDVVCRWRQHMLSPSQPIPDKVRRVGDHIMEKYQLRHLQFRKRKEVMPYARKFFHTLNSAYSDLFDFAPLTEKEIDVYIKQYFPFLNLDLTSFVVDKEDNLVAFGVAFPDMNRAYQRANGRMFPFGWYYLLRAAFAKRFANMDLLLTGVHPDWQRRGIHSISYAGINRAAQQFGIDRAYTNPQIEDYEAVKIWHNQYVAQPTMTRAVFAKSL